MRLPGRKTVTLAARWLRSRLASRALILGYHRIADDSWDPFSLSVSREHFVEHLEVIRKYGEPVRLQTLAGSLGGREFTKRAIALTFDDGYSDILQGVTPLLEKYQVPATIFVVSGTIGREFWWDELARIYSPARRSTLGHSIDIVVGNRALTLGQPFGSEKSIHELLELQRSLQPLPPSERVSVMQRIRLSLGTEIRERDAPIHRCVDEDELKLLASSALVDVGAHTHSHVELGRLSESQQESEISECKWVLEALVGGPVETFSYPHGSAPPASRRILERSGFRCGCTSVRDVVRSGTDRLRLPRLWVSNVDGENFARQLRTWLGSRN